MRPGKKRYSRSACYPLSVRKGEHNLRIGAGKKCRHGIGTVRSGECQVTLGAYSHHESRRRCQFGFERLGIGYEFRKDRGFGRGRNIGIRGRCRKQRSVIRRGIPSLKTIPGIGDGSQRASLFMAQDDPVMRQGRSFSVIQCSGDSCRTVPVFGRRGVNIHVEAVSEAVSDVERLRESRIVPDRDGIGDLRVRSRINLRFVVHAEDIGAGLLRERKLATIAYGKAVQAERSGIALNDTDMSPQRQRRRTPVDLDGEHLRRIVDTVAADCIFLIGIVHVDGIAAYTGIDFVVAQDRNIESVVTVRPNVEIRGVVTAQIDVIGQHFRSPHGADQQIGGIRGGILRVLLTLVGDRRYRTLPVRQQITVACGLLSRKFHLRALHIVVGIIRRCGCHIEHGYRARYGKKLHGAQFDIRRLDGDIVGNLRHATLDLDGRKRQDAAGRGRDRNVALIGHRQRVVIVGMRNGEILPCRAIARVAAHIGNNTHPVAARQALETQCRRGLVTVQDNLAVIIVKIEVQVPNRCFVHTGYGHHGVGTNRHFDPNFHRATAIRLILVDAAAQNAQRKQ